MVPSSIFSTDSVPHEPFTDNSQTLLNARAFNSFTYFLRQRSGSPSRRTAFETPPLPFPWWSIVCARAGPFVSFRAFSLSHCLSQGRSERIRLMAVGPASTVSRELPDRPSISSSAARLTFTTSPSVSRDRHRIVIF